MDKTRILLLALIVIVVISLIRTRKKKDKKVEKTGIITHPDIDNIYPDYPAPSPFCDDPCFAHPMSNQREANHEFRMLRMQYDTIIKRHNRMSAKIRRVNAAAKEFNDIKRLWRM